MKAEPFPVGTVLNGVKRFVVPIYQRGAAVTVKCAAHLTAPAIALWSATR